MGDVDCELFEGRMRNREILEGRFSDFLFEDKVRNCGLKNGVSKF